MSDYRDVEAQLDAADEAKKRRRENEFEQYLGDGLTVRFDGYHVVLSTPRENGLNWVGLEPNVLEAFERWLKDLRSAFGRAT